MTRTTAVNQSLGRPCVAWLSAGRALVAIDRLPSGRFRARLMIDGQRYTATLPTEADARVWEIEARGAAIRRRGAASVTFAAYATGWLAGFVETRRTVRGSRQRSSTGFPVLGELPLFEVLEADRDELERRVVDGDEGAARECLQLILGDAAEDLRVGALAAVVQVGQVPARRDRLREYTHERYSSRNRTGRRSLCRICVTAWRPMLPRSGWDGRRTKCGVWFVLARSVRIVGRVAGSCPYPRSVVCSGYGSRLVVRSPRGPHGRCSRCWRVTTRRVCRRRAGPSFEGTSGM